MSQRISMSPLVKTYTLEEFWALPEPPDRNKLELVAGVVYITPPPEQTHDAIVSRLVCPLAVHLDETNDEGDLYIPRATIWTNTRTHLEPDLFYVSTNLKARLDPERRSSATLVFEVVTPGSAIYDRNTKAETYGALGVEELWLIDERLETVEVRRQMGDGFDEGQMFARGETIISGVFPTLELRVEQLFVD